KATGAASKRSYFPQTAATSRRPRLSGEVAEPGLTRRLRAASMPVELLFHIVDAMPSETGTQSIDRAAQLLVRVVESARPPGVGELAERSGLPKSTTSRLVGALEPQGLLQRTGERGRLRPGPVLLRFAQRDVPEANLVELAEPALRRLA